MTDDEIRRGAVNQLMGLGIGIALMADGLAGDLEPAVMGTETMARIHGLLAEARDLSGRCCLAAKALRDQQDE